MRRTTSVLFLLALRTQAQDCSIPFTEPLFDVRHDSDLWYGNATRFDGGTDSLRLDLYKPVGDGQTERPLVVAIHGGGFYEGNRSELGSYCSSLASMGWACATISYRLGFYGTGLFQPPWAYDPFEVQRAIYRAAQDAKGAVRFLKGRHAQDSTSTTNVLLLGFSAGAITALHAAYMDLPAEKPVGAGALADVQHLFTFYPRPDLGAVEGELHTGSYDASVLGVVSMYGALLDTAFIGGALDPALYTYHQTGDPIVACGFNRPYWGIGFGIPDNDPYLFGSCAIAPRMQHLGFAPDRYHATVYNGNEHAVHDPTAIFNESTQWMRDLFCLSTAIPVAATTAQGLLAYPSPSSGLITLESTDGAPGLLRVQDITGRLLHEDRCTEWPCTIDLSAAPRGTHLITLIGEDGVVRRTRIVLR